MCDTQADVRAESPWISVDDDRKPVMPDGERWIYVVVYDVYRHLHIEQYWFAGDFDATTTHWLPIPPLEVVSDE